MSETLRKYGAKYNVTFCTLTGLSTDTKPTTVLVNDKAVDIANGSEFIEMDTDKKYLYDADSQTWKLASSGGGGGGGGSATLIEKTINANGIYTATSDNADGYSKVTTNVPNTYAFIGMRLPENITIESYYMPVILPDSNGEFNCSTVPIGGAGYSVSLKIIAAQPVKLIKGSPAPTFEVFFTPTDDFQGFDYNITPTGATITGGDGFVYRAIIDVAISPSITVYKTSQQVITGD